MLDFLYYPVSFVMRLWHELFGALLGPTSGLAWALSVVFLVLTVRALLVRSAWTRMRAARITRALGPQLATLVQQTAITRLLDRRPPPLAHRDRSAR